MGNKQSIEIPNLPRQTASVCYNILSKHPQSGKRASKRCEIDFFDFWWMFYNPLRENGQPRQWTCTKRVSWIYEVPNLPAPQYQDMYSMLRYPLIEYASMHIYNFMRLVSDRHDTEIMVARSQLEILRENCADLSQVFLNTIDFITMDLMAAKNAKPWYGTGKSDPQKNQKRWLAHQLKTYRRNLHICIEAFDDMLNTMFPYGDDPEINELVFPLSAWQLNWDYDAGIINIPDWQFEDPFQSFLEGFAVREFNDANGYKRERLLNPYEALSRKEWKRTRHQLCPVASLGTLKYLEVEPVRKQEWKIDMTDMDPWTLRELFAKMRDKKCFRI